MQDLSRLSLRIPLDYLQGMKKSSKLTLRMSPETRARLEAKAKQERRSLAFIANELIEAGLEPPTPHETRTAYKIHAHKPAKEG